MNAPFTHLDLPASNTPPLAAEPAGICVATVSLIVPVCNDEAMIAPFLEAVYRNTELLTEQGIVFDLIFVNDGSTDTTLDCLLLAQREDPRIRVVDLSRGFGRDAALTAGLDLCHADAAIPMGVDLSDPPHVIPDLIEKWREGFEVVLARRTAGDDRSLAGRLRGSKTPDDAGEFRLIDRHVLDALRTLPERRRVMKGLFGWVGFNAVTVDYEGEPMPSHRGRRRGAHHGARENFASFSTVPLEVWTYIGAGIACLSFLYGMAVVGKAVLFGADVPGHASLLASVLFLGGVQLLGIGVLGQYLGRVYSEIKQRPVYIVRRTFEAG
jgi:glycosyltransferase involved in cell wall biosynthesis